MVGFTYYPHCQSYSHPVANLIVVFIRQTWFTLYGSSPLGRHHQAPIHYLPISKGYSVTYILNQNGRLASSFGSARPISYPR